MTCQPWTEELRYEGTLLVLTAFDYKHLSDGESSLHLCLRDNTVEPEMLQNLLLWEKRKLSVSCKKESS